MKLTQRNIIELLICAPDGIGEKFEQAHVREKESSILSIVVEIRGLGHEVALTAGGTDLSQIR